MYKLDQTIYVTILSIKKKVRMVILKKNFFKDSLTTVKKHIFCIFNIII